jgi:hypothetical protein
VAGYHLRCDEIEELDDGIEDLDMADRRGTEIVEGWPAEAKGAADVAFDTSRASRPPDVPEPAPSPDPVPAPRPPPGTPDPGPRGER